jgi:hypothetical protein
MPRTVLSFESDHDEALPCVFTGQDVRLPKAFVRHVLERYTQIGGVVLDPFAGYATALIVAEQLGRVCHGIEADRARFEYGRSKLRNPELLLHGDSLHLAQYQLPVLDLVFFSPPYMHKTCERNPLRGDLQQANAYHRYLQDLHTIAAAGWQRLRHGGHLVVEASNLINEAGVTSLAWDIASAFSVDFPFQGEQVLNWTGGYGYGYDHSYCLVFGRSGA